MKKILIISSLTILLGAAMSCTRETVGTNPYGSTEVEIVSSDLFFAPAGGSKTVTVSASGSVSATSNKDWFKASVSGNTITVTADPHYEYTSRSGLLTITEGENVSEIAVQQQGVCFNSKADSIAVPRVDASKNIYYTTNVELTLTTSDSWLSATLDEDGEGTFINITAEDSEDFRIGYVYVDYVTSQDTIKVLQLGNLMGKYYLDAYFYISSTKTYNESYFEVELVEEDGSYAIDFSPLFESDLKIPFSFDESNTSDLAFKDINACIMGEYGSSATYPYMLFCPWDSDTGYVTWKNTVGFNAPVTIKASDDGSVDVYAVLEDNGAWGSYTVSGFIFYQCKVSDISSVKSASRGGYYLRGYDPVLYKVQE